ncbi:uncharacterized protein CLUP02_05988 [Colletotrichum lupini]|uniref:Uncharacterized protein n=1 Tax=Colletotrichum lupini TaxID=145971 RepID=A0A9Q8SNL8_9PEZI|nr:uncharacterized protein CLUP02_05988 [Colletotrichum lupini]UQC80505.1 hypothetical protein CLUP02_05988 [Colletotrichum lupini]
MVSLPPRCKSSGGCLPTIHPYGGPILTIAMSVITETLHRFLEVQKDEVRASSAFLSVPAPSKHEGTALVQVQVTPLGRHSEQRLGGLLVETGEGEEGGCSTWGRRGERPRERSPMELYHEDEVSPHAPRRLRDVGCPPWTASGVIPGWTTRDREIGKHKNKNKNKESTTIDPVTAMRHPAVVNGHTGLGLPIVGQTRPEPGKRRQGKPTQITSIRSKREPVPFETLDTAFAFSAYEPVCFIFRLVSIPSHLPNPLFSSFVRSFLSSFLSSQPKVSSTPILSSTGIARYSLHTPSAQAHASKLFSTVLQIVSVLPYPYLLGCCRFFARAERQTNGRTLVATNDLERTNPTRFVPYPLVQRTSPTKTHGFDHTDLAFRTLLSRKPTLLSLIPTWLALLPKHPNLNIITSPPPSTTTPGYLRTTQKRRLDGKKRLDSSIHRLVFLLSFAAVLNKPRNHLVTGHTYLPHKTSTNTRTPAHAHTHTPPILSSNPGLAPT